MSLLMDALRKAEQAKREGRMDAAAPGVADPPPAADAAGDPETLAVQPSEPSATLPDLLPMPEATATEAPATLPDLPLSLQKLDDEFMAEASRKPMPTRPQPSSTSAPARAAATTTKSPPPKTKATSTDAANRSAAQNAFAAKQPAAASNRTFATVVGAVTLLAVAGIGVYFWLQLKPSPVLSTRPIAAPDATANGPRQRPVALPDSLPAPPLTARAADGPPAEPSAPVRPVEARRAPAPSPAAADNPIRITTSHLRMDPALTEGFDALQAGNLPKARADYERVLQSDPRNADALHGVAAIALREGRSGAAETYYLRLLEADPQDAAAQAGLLGLRGQGDPVASESRLKSLLAAQPDAPVLQFALGNIFARQSRWSEAQEAYFKAVTGDGNNPDYLFNLAVSLDQLHQPKLAAQYYRQALTAAATRPAGFDQDKVAARLRDLQP